MKFYIREVAARHPFHTIPYLKIEDANRRKDELNRFEARKEDGTVYEVVSDLTLAVEEDREFKYRDANEW